MHIFDVLTILLPLPSLYNVDANEMKEIERLLPACHPLGEPRKGRPRDRPQITLYQRLYRLIQQQLFSYRSTITVSHLIPLRDTSYDHQLTLCPFQQASPNPPFSHFRTSFTPRSRPFTPV